MWAGNSHDETPSPQSGSLESKLDIVVRGYDNAQAFLLVVKGRNAGQVHVIDRIDKTIGRSRAADIRVNERSVSSLHARVSLVGEHHLIIDLSSTNGTFVNEERIRGEVELHGGDVIQVGETVLAYLTTQQPESERTTALARISPKYLASANRTFAALPQLGSVRDVTASSVEEGPSLRDALEKMLMLQRFLRRYQRLLLVFAVLFAVLGNLSGYVMPPPSTANFEISLKPDLKRISTETRDANQQTAGAFFDSAEKTFINEDLVRATLNKLGEKNPTIGRVRSVQRRIKFESAGLHLYQGSYTDATAEKTVNFLDQHLQNYLDTEIEKMLRRIRKEAEFLSSELAEKRTGLERTEQILADFKKKNAYAFSDQFKNVLGQLAVGSGGGTVSSKLAQLDLEIRQIEAKLSRGDLRGDSRARAAEPFKQDLVDRTRRLQELKAQGLDEGHPDVQRLRRESAGLKSQIEQIMRTGPQVTDPTVNASEQSLRDQLAGLKLARQIAQSEIHGVAGTRQKFENLLKELPEIERQHEELTRGRNEAKQRHDDLSRKLQEVELQLELERASAAAHYEILTRPNSEGVSMRRTLLLRTLMGVVVGLMLAVVVGAYRELRRYMETAM